MIICGFTPFFGNVSIPNPYPISDNILLPFFSLVKTKIEKFYLLLSSLILDSCFEWKEGNLQKKLNQKLILSKTLPIIIKTDSSRDFGFRDEGESSVEECYAFSGFAV